jgi:uncharacterized repeat protein (TIGR04052 family)
MAGALCTGLLLACGDDTADTSDKGDAAAEHGHDAGSSKPKTSTKNTGSSESATKQADAGHADAGAAKTDKQPSQADSAKDAGAPSDKNKDTQKAPADKPADKDTHKDTAPESLKVSIRFQAKLGKTDFACSHKLPSQGTANTTVTPTDFRLFVHALELIKDDGSKVPVTLNVREPWQSASLALLDFEDKTGRCSDGTEGTNTAVTGTVAPGTYKGVRFIVGVPDDLDHKDQAGAAEPLKSAAGLGPQGTSGFRFAKVGLQALVAGGNSTGSGLFELGSAQCAAAMGGGDVKCDKVNRSVIELPAFDIEKNSIVIDGAALFSTLDLTQTNECHSTEKVCAPMFGALGVDFATGQPKAGQTLFRVE